MVVKQITKKQNILLSQISPFYIKIIKNLRQVRVDKILIWYDII